MRARKALKLAALKALSLGAPRRGTYVLMYHSVGAVDAPFNVPPPLFREQMSMLEGEGIPVIPLAEALHPAPGLRAALTFDDAYRDLLDFALPELRARGRPATVFAPAGALGQELLISNGSRARVMTAGELSSLKALGFSIGSHAWSHRTLTGLAEEELRRELKDSKARLEELWGGEVSHLAYPKGRFDARVEAGARAAGYSAAWTAREGSVEASGSPYRLRRVAVLAETSPAELRLRLGPALDRFERLLGR